MTLPALMHKHNSAIQPEEKCYVEKQKLNIAVRNKRISVKLFLWRNIKRGEICHNDRFGCVAPSSIMRQEQEKDYCLPPRLQYIQSVIWWLCFCVCNRTYFMLPDCSSRSFNLGVQWIWYCRSTALVDLSSKNMLFCLYINVCTLNYPAIYL